MRIGVPRERLTGEGRVGLLPYAVRELLAAGHEIFIEVGAGDLAGILDDTFREAGATLIADASSLYAQSDLVVKVKEPLEEEVELLRKDQMLFCFLHLAAHPHLLDDLMAKECLPIACERIRASDGTWPVLAPMSRIAGRLAVQMGAVYLLQPYGGKGLLLGAESDEAAGHVVVLGCGESGRAAIETAVGLGAWVTALDIKPAVLEALKQQYGDGIKVQLSTEAAIAEAVAQADLLIGAVLVPGAKAPQLIYREHVRQMETGSVIVDIAIDQGGCCETSHPTTYDAPIFIESGVVHCCVKNLPAAVSRTASIALVEASLPYVQRIAALGAEGLRKDPIVGAALAVK